MLLEKKKGFFGRLSQRLGEAMHLRGTVDEELLDEIEEMALRLEGVDECCALYQKEKQLLYLFYTGTADAKTITLHFREQLPAFMVPRRIRALNAMPRLANGKKDMRALQEML